MNNKKLDKLIKSVSLMDILKNESVSIEVLDDNTSGELYGGWKPICIIRK